MDQNKQIKIRSTDSCPPGGAPFNPDHCSTALDMKQRIASVERKQAEMTTAFLLNDLGAPDFDGHRKDHLAIRNASEVMARYKIGATEKLIGIVILAVLALLNTGLWHKLLEVLK